MASKLAAALQVGESLVWKPEPKPTADTTHAQRPADGPAGVKEPEPQREDTMTPGARPVTSTNVDADLAPTPYPETPAPSFPPNRDEVPETPLPNLPGDEEEEEYAGASGGHPPAAGSYHPPPGEPMMQKREGELSSLPTPFGKTIPPLPFKLGGSRLPPVSGQGTSLDDLPSPPEVDLPPTYAEVEMADKLSGKKKKKSKEPKPQLEAL